MELLWGEEGPLFIDLELLRLRRPSEARRPRLGLWCFLLLSVVMPGCERVVLWEVTSISIPPPLLYIYYFADQGTSCDAGIRGASSCSAP